VLTPHSLRHSHKTLMIELRTPEILSHERLGHELGGIGGRYSHVTSAMRQELIESLTEQWLAALDERLAMHPRSPVQALDQLLSERRGARQPPAAIPVMPPPDAPDGKPSLRARAPLQRR
jgi:integrase